MMIAWATPRLLAKFRHKTEFLAMSSAVILVALIMHTHYQVSRWRNSVTLFEHALEVTTNNSATEQTTVNALPEADLAVSKADEADPVLVGENVTYTVTVSNNGPDTAENVVLTDDLPTGVNFVSAAPAADCSELAGTVTCDLTDCQEDYSACSIQDFCGAQGWYEEHSLLLDSLGQITIHVDPMYDSVNSCVETAFDGFGATYMNNHLHVRLVSLFYGRLQFLLFHDSYHVGQTDLLRQMSGKSDKVI